jgi:hypothetical protein
LSTLRCFTPHRLSSASACKTPSYLRCSPCSGSAP